MLTHHWDTCNWRMFAHRALLRPLSTAPTYRTAYARAALRAFSTTDLPNGIKIAYDLHEPPKESSSRQNAPSIVFIHGLFGSKQNNRSMSKYAPSASTLVLSTTLTTVQSLRARAEPSCIRH